MKYMKFFICIIIIFTLAIDITSVYGGFLEDIVTEGKGFFQPGSGTDQGNVGATISTALQDSLIPVIETIGNLIFYSVAVFLGLKYIWSSVEGKSQVKETLPTFVVASCVFYLSTTIYTFVTDVIKNIAGGSTFQIIEGNLWSNIELVANILAISGIVALGLKYMFAAADTKADIKKDMIPVVIGIVLIYSITNILSFLVTAGGQIL